MKAFIQRGGQEAARRKARHATMHREVIARKEDPYDFWRRIGAPKTVVAPMVEHSDLAYRQLTRKYGADIAYTQMFNANIFSNGSEHMFQTCADDRPLIVQFAGHDPSTLLSAALKVQDKCDAVDINLGCPQNIAKRGRYGAFLMEELDLLYNIVSTLVQGLKIPVTCKTRIYKDFEKCIELCETLVRAGASLLTIHGRTRDEKGHRVGAVDWDMIKRIKHHFQGRVPVIANGGIEDYNDIERCLSYTGCDGVMSSEAILENPTLFCGNDSITMIDLTLEYLEYAEKYRAPWSSIRGHCMKMLHRYFAVHIDIRDQISTTKTIDDIVAIIMDLKKIVICDKDYQEKWYSRHRSIHTAHSGSPMNGSNGKVVLHIKDKLLESTNEDDNEGCLMGLFD